MNQAEMVNTAFFQLKNKILRLRDVSGFLSFVRLRAS